MSMIVLDETQDYVEDVMTQVSKAVVATMGPNGKLSLIMNGNAVKVTKDGVTVAKAIKFEDPAHELINRVITEAAIKTDHECGDGTTTTVMLTGELYSLFSRYPGFRDQRFIETCVQAIIDELKIMAIQIKTDDERLYKLALTSSNSDHELSKIVTDIYKDAGERYPEIELKEGQASDDKVVRSQGLPLNMSFSNPGFSQHGNGADTSLVNFVVFVVDAALGRGGDNMIDTLVALHEQYLHLSHILIVARSVEHEMCSAMLNINNSVRAAQQMGKIANRFAGGPQFVAVNTNAGGSVGSLVMADIATVFGVPVFTDLKDAIGANLVSSSPNVNISNTRSVVTHLLDEDRERLNRRVTDIEAELNGYEMGDRFSVRAKFNETRIRNLRGELVTVFVGGETYSEVKERLDRFEDVVKAVKSALVNGVLPGVGSSLIIAGRRALLKVIAQDPDARSQNPQDKIFDQVFGSVFGPTLTKESEIIKELGTLIFTPYTHLMEQVDHKQDNSKEIFWGGEEIIPVCVNLATGDVGTSEELGVYDTAYATITALKGGLQTAKILANASSVLLGGKLNAVLVK